MYPRILAALASLLAVSPLALAQVDPTTRTETRVATHFSVFVPPANVAGRRSAIVVTALSGGGDRPTRVQLIDEADDGDADDSVDVQLFKGNSYVHYIGDGATNDDHGGKADGDHLRVLASLPVSVFLATDSDWQHDWAPSTNGTLRGQVFYLFSNTNSVSNRDVDVFAYEDGTRVELYDITRDALGRSQTGVARTGPRGAPLLRADLSEGQSLLRDQGAGADLLAPGRTYELLASHPVTVQYGAIASVVPQNQARDGGGFVPGRSGQPQDDLFYFAIPHNPDLAREQELRIVAVDDGVRVRLDAWEDGGWVSLLDDTINRFAHLDWVGGASRRYRLRATGGKINAFEANWLETGAAGTSDVMAFAPGRFTAAGGHEFVTYLGPPGAQGATAFGSTESHLFITSFGGGEVRVKDADTDGTLVDRTVQIPPDGLAIVSVDQATYNSLNRAGEGIRPYLKVEADGPVSVASANFNDNWMAYATSPLYQNPEVSLVLPDAAEIGAQVPVTGAVTNTGDVALQDVAVDVVLDDSLRFVAGTVDGQGPVNQDDGSVSFVVDQLAPGASADVNLTVEVAAGSPGQVAPITVVVGDEAAEIAGGAASGGLTLTDAAAFELSGLTAQVGDGQVLLRWTQQADAGVQASVSVEAASAAGGPYSVVAGTLAPATGTGQPQAAERTLEGLRNGTPVYLRVRADTAELATLLGPVVAVPSDNTPPAVPTLTAEAGDGRVTLAFESPDADVVGYELQRSVDGGRSWQAAHAGTLAGPIHVDDGRANGVTVSYRVRALDDDGNRSGLSPVRIATPRQGDPPRNDQVVLGFEDMIGEGENDWDHNDFVVRVSSTVYAVGGGVEQVVFSYEALARGAGYQHSLHQKLPGGGAWLAEVVRFDAAGREVDREQTTGQGPVDVVVWHDTRDPLPAVQGNYANTLADQADFVAGGQAQLTVTFARPMQNPAADLGAGPWDVYLLLPYRPLPNTIHRPGYGGQTETSARHPELAGLPLDFVVELPFDEPEWPKEGAAMWRDFPDFVPKARGEAGAGRLVAEDRRRVFHERRRGGN